MPRLNDLDVTDAMVVGNTCRRSNLAPRYRPDWCTAEDGLISHRSLLERWTGSWYLIADRPACEEAEDYCQSPCAWCLWRILSLYDACGSCIACQDAEFFKAAEECTVVARPAALERRLMYGWVLRANRNDFRTLYFQLAYLGELDSFITTACCLGIPELLTFPVASPGAGSHHHV